MKILLIMVALIGGTITGCSKSEANWKCPECGCGSDSSCGCCPGKECQCKGGSCHDCCPDCPGHHH